MGGCRLVASFALLLIAAPAFAQVDFSVEWAPRFYEDQPERVPGPELGGRAAGLHPGAAAAEAIAALPFSATWR